MQRHALFQMCDYKLLYTDKPPAHKPTLKERERKGSLPLSQRLCMALDKLKRPDSASKSDLSMQQHDVRRMMSSAKRARQTSKQPATSTLSTKKTNRKST